MNYWKTNRISLELLLAPLIFICHFLEESPGFVQWFNSHVARGITSETFWNVNISGLIITLFVVGIEWFSRSALSLILAVAWLGSVMFANGLFHIASSVVDGQYVPGLVRHNRKSSNYSSATVPCLDGRFRRFAVRQ